MEWNKLGYHTYSVKRINSWQKACFILAEGKEDTGGITAIVSVEFLHKGGFYRSIYHTTW
jgi:hypothetical protein